MHSNQNEYSLLSELQKGNQTAFQEIYFIYSSAIQLNILKLIKDPVSACDLLQDVFIALWENKHKIDPKKGIAPWLYTVSYNKSLKFLRKKIKDELLLSNTIEINLFSDDTDSEFEEDEIKLAAIYEALELLPERKKMAFCEYRLKGKPLAEIAVTMGITKETTKSYIKEARKQILEYIEKKSATTISIGTTTFLFWILHI